MKKLLLLGVAVLAGCAQNPTFTGQSVTDPQLRQDVMKNVRTLFSVVANCGRISDVKTSISTLDQTPSGAVQKAVERWQVTGCGTSKDFNIQMTADAQGETNFSVSLARNAQ